MMTSVSRGLHERSKARLVVAAAVLAVGGLVVTANPAMAATSSSWTTSPAGCTGGFGGSSYPDGVDSRATTGNNGSTCTGTRPAVYAAVRGPDGVIHSIFSSTGQFVGAIKVNTGGGFNWGGYHKWGTISRTTA